jgi:hypothetical protein
VASTSAASSDAPVCTSFGSLSRSRWQSPLYSTRTAIEAQRPISSTLVPVENQRRVVILLVRGGGSLVAAAIMRALSEGTELLGPDGRPSQVTRARGPGAGEPIRSTPHSVGSSGGFAQLGGPDRQGKTERFDPGC